MIRTSLVACLAIASFACSSSDNSGSGSAVDASTSETSTPRTDAAADTSSPATTDAARDAAIEASTDATASGTCAGIPAGAKLQGPLCTTGASGTFTESTYDSTANTYSQDCNVDPYVDQADFDANEGTSTVSGVTIVSHEDYVRTASCASGSIDYTAQASAKTTIVFVWTKVP